MKKLIVFIFLLPVIAFGQEDKFNNCITVFGSSDIEVAPDWITLGMTANHTENTKKESDIVKMENSILKMIVSLGFDSSCFSIDRFSANTKYNYSSTTKFRLEKSYSLKIDNVNYFDTLIALCFEAGMDNIYINQIGHSKIDSLQNKVLQDALFKAKEKAKLIEQTLNIQLGKVISVNETYRMINNQSGSYNYDDYQLEDVVVVGYGTQNKTRLSSSLSLQKIKINKTVTVKYQIQ